MFPGKISVEFGLLLYALELADLGKAFGIKRCPLNLNQIDRLVFSFVGWQIF